MFADWSPALDVEETDQEYVLKTDLPEVKKENVKIGIESNVLTIEGERKYEKDETTKRLHRMERNYGKFVRRLTVPTEVDQQKIESWFYWSKSQAFHFQNGTLYGKSDWSTTGSAPSGKK